MDRAKVLVVEDETIVAEDIAEVVESSGHDVVAKAPSAEQAMVKAAAERPELAIIDIRLSGRMDGVELAASLRKRYGVAVIFLTAYADEATLERAKVTEPHSYLIKPFEPRELRGAISIALHKRRSESRQVQLEKEKEQIAQELRRALERLRALAALLPLCPACGRVRLADGSWRRPEGSEEAAVVAEAAAGARIRGEGKAYGQASAGLDAGAGELCPPCRQERGRDTT
jgi:CheY-like chemotaxis protein